MKKRLNIDQIQSELRGGSAFFPDYKGGDHSPTDPSQEPNPADSSPPVEAPPYQDNKTSAPPAQHRPDGDTVIPRHHDTNTSRNTDDTVEVVRKVVKQLGKEAATYRFTQEEKKVLSDIVYQYKGQGIRTSENEITRIAINGLVEEYRKHKKNSLLARVLERLNS